MCFTDSQLMLVLALMFVLQEVLKVVKVQEVLKVVKTLKIKQVVVFIVLVVVQQNYIYMVCYLWFLKNYIFMEIQRTLAHKIYFDDILMI